MGYKGISKGNIPHQLITIDLIGMGYFSDILKGYIQFTEIGEIYGNSLFWSYMYLFTLCVIRIYIFGMDWLNTLYHTILKRHALNYSRAIYEFNYFSIGILTKYW